MVLCLRCAGVTAALETSRTVPCGFCGVATAAWQTRAVVVASGIKMSCAACRDKPAEEAPAPLPPPRPPVARPSSRRWRVLAAGAAATAVASLYAWVSRGSTLEMAAHAASSVAIAVRPEPQPPTYLPFFVPLVVSIPSRLPAIPAGSTIHPLPGSDRVLPGNSSSSFGADRAGDRPIECGAGHCGVDLVADLGTPVLAARAGTIETVRRDAGGRGGRWVKIEHRGDVATLYFHLDEIREDLAPGVHVEAGERIGTLGRTGVVSSPTHLHFAVYTGGTYVDPMPMLRAARVVASLR